MDRHIRDVLESNAPPAQEPVCLPTRETALHQLVTRIEKTLDTKGIALGAFLDIEGTFDNTSYLSIIRSAKHKGIDTLCRRTDATLNGRKMMTTLFEETVEVLVGGGCPRVGGVLSPLLWNLVIDRLTENLNNAGYYNQGYIDDLAILILGKEFNTTMDIMQGDVKIVEDWCNVEGLRVSPRKTALIPFTYKRRDRNITLTLFGERLTLLREVKYLGVILDDKLTWNQHIDSKLNQAKLCMATCRISFRKKWGLKPSMVIWLYVVAVTPIITYAATVWWPKTEQTTVRTKLNSLQRLVCLGTTGAITTNPQLQWKPF
jgi:hypothetical protein